MLMEESWVAAVEDCRKEKSSHFHSASENQRLEASLAAKGFSVSKGVRCEVAADGVQ